MLWAGVPQQPTSTAPELDLVAASAMPAPSFAVDLVGCVAACVIPVVSVSDGLRSDLSVDAVFKLFYQIDLKKLVAYSTVVEMH